MVASQLEATQLILSYLLIYRLDKISSVLTLLLYKTHEKT